jgi:hypothetical protein
VAVVTVACGSRDDKRTPSSSSKTAAGRETTPRPARPPDRAVVPLSVEPRLPAGAKTYADHENGARVTLPSDWHRATDDVAPQLASGQVLAVGSFPIRRNRRASCSRAPDQPEVRVGPRDALVFVEEDTRARADLAPARPRRFRLWKQLNPTDQAPVAGRARIFPWDCLNRRGVAGLWTVFGDGDRVFSVTAIVGKAATPETQSTTLAVLNSLRFRNR